MTQLADFAPLRIESQRERIGREREEESQRPGFFRAVGDAISSEWASSWFYRMLDRQGYDFDPSWSLPADNDDRFKALTANLDPDLWESFAGTHSYDHAVKVREQLLSVQESRRRLASLGWGGTALQIGASILDPAFIAAGVVTGGTGFVAGAGAKAGRLGMLIRGGLVAAATDAPINAFIASQDPEFGTRDVLYSTAGSFLLGGSFSALFGKRGHEAASRIRKNIEAGDTLEFAMGAAARRELTPETRKMLDEMVLTKAGRAYFKEQIDPEQSRKLVDRLIAESLDEVDDAAEIAALRSLDPDELLTRLTGESTLPPRNPNLRQSTPEEVEARAMQIMEEDNLSQYIDEEAVSTEPIRMKVYRGTPAGKDATDTSNTLGNALFTTDSPKRAAVYGTNAGGTIAEFDVTLRRPLMGQSLILRKQFGLPPGGVDADLINAARKAGHDSIIIKSWYDGKESDEVILLTKSPLSPTLSLEEARELAIKQIADEEATKKGIKPDTTKKPAEPASGKAPPPAKPPKVATDFFITPMDDVSAKPFGIARGDMVGQLGQSQSPLVRMVSNSLAEDYLTKASGRGQSDAASLWVNRTYASHMARFWRVAEQEFKSWARERQVPYRKWLKEKKFFFEQVGKTIRTGRGTVSSPQINKVADAIRGLQKEVLDLAKRHGVKHALKVDANDNYLTRRWNTALVVKAKAKWGDGVDQFFADAIRQVSPDIDADKAAKIGRGFVNSITHLDDYVDIERAALFSEDGSDVLERILRQNVPGITDAEVEDIIYATMKRPDDTNVQPRLKRRLRIDENHRATMPDGSVLDMTDLLENDASVLFTGYTRQMVGASAMSEVYRAFKRSEDDVLESWSKLKERVAKDLDERGIPAHDRDTQLGKLDTLHKAVAGYRLSANTKAAAAGRIARSINHIRLSGGFGFAQLPELGNLIGSAGVRVMLQQMPTLRSVFARAKDGRLSNELLEEIETLMGLGTDRLTHQVIDRFDDAASIESFGGGAAERMLERGSRVANDLSGMAQINIALQRSAGAMAVQKWINIADSGKLPSAKRLASMGLNEADAKAIIEQIKKHAVTEDGAFGRRARRINLNAWTDSTAASKFIVALDRWSRRVIQHNDIGNMHHWMTGDIARIFTQFRTFSLVAWGKQTLHRVQMADFEAFSSAMWASLVAGLGYMGMHYSRAVGRDDAAEYKKKFLSTGEIAKAAFARGGWSSMLPGGFDTLQYFTGGHPAFGPSRTTGLDANFVLGNPTIATFQDAQRASWSVMSKGRSAVGLRDEPVEFTEKDGRALANLLPLRNVMGIKNIIDAFVTRLPEDE